MFLAVIARFGPTAFSLLWIAIEAASGRAARSTVERLGAFREVPDNRTNVRAQCEANCLSYTSSLIDIAWQPYQCDKPCKQCRMAACKNLMDSQACRQRCREFLPKGNTTGLPKCEDGCNFVERLRTNLIKRDPELIPQYPLTGPQLLKDRPVNESQWLTWVGAFHMSFAHEEDDSSTQEARSFATVYEIRRLEVTALPNGSLQESFKSSVVTRRPIVKVSKIFRQDSKKLSSDSCHIFEVAAVSQYGMRGFLRNTNMYSPYTLGVDGVAKPSTECWRRICLAPVSGFSGLSVKNASVRITEESREFDRQTGYSRVVVRWTTNMPAHKAPNRCFLLRVTTLDADRERCGKDKEIVLMKEERQFAIDDLFELCKYTFKIILLPTNISDEFTVTLPPSDDARKARNIQVFNTSFEAPRKGRPSKRRSVLLEATISWQQPMDQHGLRGFCLLVFEAVSGFIAKPKPSFIHCRNNMIPLKPGSQAVYTQQVGGLSPNQEYLVEVATMVENKMSTLTADVKFTTPNLMPENLELASLTATVATIKWHLDRCQSLSRQGGRLHVILARLGQKSQDRPKQPTGKYRKKQERERSSWLVPRWDKVKELVLTNRSHFRMTDLDLSDKENYSFVLRDLDPQMTYAVVVYGPSLTGVVGQASNELIFTTLPAEAPTTSSKENLISRQDWYKTTRGRVIIMICSLFVFVSLILCFLLLYRRQERMSIYPRRNTCCGLNGFWYSRRGDVPSRPTTWLPHDANAIPHTRTLERHLSERSSFFSSQPYSNSESVRQNGSNRDGYAMTGNDTSREWTHTPNNQPIWHTADYNTAQGSVHLSTTSSTPSQAGLQPPPTSVKSNSGSYLVRPQCSLLNNAVAAHFPAESPEESYVSGDDSLPQQD